MRRLERDTNEIPREMRAHINALIDRLGSLSADDIATITNTQACRECQRLDRNHTGPCGWSLNRAWWGNESAFHTVEVRTAAQRATPGADLGRPAHTRDLRVMYTPENIAGMRVIRAWLHCDAPQLRIDLFDWAPLIGRPAESYHFFGAVTQAAPRVSHLRMAVDAGGGGDVGDTPSPSSAVACVSPPERKTLTSLWRNIVFSP